MINQIKPQWKSLQQFSRTNPSDENTNDVAGRMIVDNEKGRHILFPIWTLEVLFWCLLLTLWQHRHIIY